METIDLMPAARDRPQQARVFIVDVDHALVVESNKIIKPETEVRGTGLMKFINWLEEQNFSTQGIVLMHMDQRKFIPPMKFQRLVEFDRPSSFTNVAKDNMAIEGPTQKPLGFSSQFVRVRTLSDLLLKDNDFHPDDYGAYLRMRAKQAVFVAIDNCERQLQPECDPNVANHAIDAYSEAINAYGGLVSLQYTLFKRENSFIPLFTNYIRTNEQRMRAGKFRTRLTENGFALRTLKAMWEDKGVDGLIMGLQSINDLTDDERTDLITLMDHYFDPNKLYDSQLNELKPSFKKSDSDISEYFKNDVLLISAVKFRNFLAGNGFNLMALNAIWQEKGKKGLIVKLKPIGLNKQEMTELIALMDNHFEPKNDATKPMAKPKYRRRPRDDTFALSSSDEENDTTPKKPLNLTWNGTGNVSLEQLWRDSIPLHLRSPTKKFYFQNADFLNSFNPIFLEYFKTTVQRMRTIRLRTRLATNGFSLNTLDAIWIDKGVEGLTMALQVVKVKDDEKSELIALLDSYFDPDKQLNKPVSKPDSRRPGRRHKPTSSSTERPAPKNHVNFTNEKRWCKRHQRRL